MGTGKMRSIRDKILKSILFTASVSLACCIFISLFAVNSIKNTAEQTGRESGRIAAESSADTLISLSTAQALEYTKCCAETVGLKIKTIISALETVNGEIKNIYENPNGYLPRKYGHPSEYPADTYCMQWVLPDGVSMEANIEKETYLLGNLESLFGNTMTAYGSVLEIYFTSSTGINIGYDRTPQTKPETYDGRTSEWYLYAEETWCTYISEPYRDSFGRGLMISIAMPCRGENGELYGVVGADILIGELDGFIAEMNAGEGSHALLVSRGSVICAEGLTAENTKDFTVFFGKSGNDIVRRMYDNASGIIRAEINGEDVYCVYSAAGISDWITVMIILRDKITEPAAELESSILETAESSAAVLDLQMRGITILWGIVFAAVVIITVIVTNKISSSLSEPITRLCSAVKKVGGGDLDYKCEIKSGDEIETLSDSFAEMTVSLKDYMENYANIAAEKQRISTELNVAAQIQASVLPCIFPAYPERTEFDIYAKMSPAKEVGGDFYDFYITGENKLCLIMADVSGKGVPAALFMMISKILIKNLAFEGLSVNEIFDRANSLLNETNESLMFVTAFMAIVDLRTGVMEFVNAGHNPPALRRKNGSFRFLDIKKDCVLAALPDVKYRKQSVRLEEGDMLFAYTDGVTEAVNTDTELYGEDRLIDTLNAIPDADSVGTKEIAGAVRKDIDVFAGGAEAADDITMLIFKYLSAGE